MVKSYWVRLKLGWLIGNTALATSEGYVNVQAHPVAHCHPRSHLTLKSTRKLSLELGVKLKGTSLHDLHIAKWLLYRVKYSKSLPSL